MKAEVGRKRKCVPFWCETLTHYSLYIFFSAKFYMEFPFKPMHGFTKMSSRAFVDSLWGK